MATQQQIADGLCLRFSGDIQNQPGLTMEMAVNLLIRGTQASLQLPYAWGYIDRPAGTLFFHQFRVCHNVRALKPPFDTDGAIYLVFVASHMSFPTDGMRFQENEQRYAIAAGNGRVRHPSISTFTPIIDLRHTRFRRSK